MRRGLRHVEHERKRTPATLGDYRSSVRAWLLPGFGAHTPLGAIDTAAIDGWRASLLGEGRLSPRSIQKCVRVSLPVFCLRNIHPNWSLVSTGPATRQKHWSQPSMSLRVAARA